MIKINHNHTHHTTVTENRAPTDESIRLAEEMREKALDRIIDNIKVGDNVFEAQAVQVAMNMRTFNPDLHALFKLNGQKYHIVTEMDNILMLTEPDLLKRRLIIAEQLGHAIAVKLMVMLPEKDQ